MSTLTLAQTGTVMAQAPVGDVFLGIGKLSEAGSQAFALSSDALVVVGQSGGRPFRWASGSMSDIGGLVAAGSGIARSVSADGSVVVGESAYPPGMYGNMYPVVHAFRWTGGSMQDLGTLNGGMTSTALFVSADGGVVAGNSSVPPSLAPYGMQRNHAFRWAAGVMQDLGTLHGGESSASAMTPDGTFIIGESDGQAFRWANGVMQGLGTLGGESSTARAVSRDGRAVVGESSLSGTGGSHAYRWYHGAMHDLGTLGGTRSSASWVSGDGGVVAGVSTVGGDATSHAFRWADGMMRDLGTLGGDYSAVTGLSANGKVVVGSSNLVVSPNSNDHGVLQPFRWTEAGGMRSVTRWLADARVTVPADWTLGSVVAINEDGSVLVGNGTNPSGVAEAWFARVGDAGSGLITDVPGFNSGLVETGRRGVQGGALLGGMVLSDVHHRSLMDVGGASGGKTTCAWATADVAGRREGDFHLSLAESGFCGDVGVVRLGLGIGLSRVWQSWQLGGDARLDGQYLVAEAASAIGDNLISSATGYFGRFSGDLQRNYLNGATVDRSTGQTSADATGLRIRLDGRSRDLFASIGLSGYIAYTWTSTALDAYIETGGGFPAAFPDTTLRNNEVSLGVSVRRSIAHATDLRVTLDGGRRFDRTEHGGSGEVVGLWHFDLPSGGTVRTNWGRLMFDLDHRISASSIVGANAYGGNVGWGLSVNWRGTF